MKNSVKALCIFLSVLLVVASSIYIFSAENGVDNPSVPADGIKNVILFVPDGLSSSAMSVARLVKGEALFVDQYLYSMVKTQMATGPITDAAPAATSYATGYKSAPGYVGIDENGVPKATILEAAKEAGMKTGIVTNCSYCYATTAAFSAHASDRSDFYSVGLQMLNKHIDVVLGGGSKNSVLMNKNIDTAKEAAKQGYTVVSDKASLLAADTDKLWGCFFDYTGATNFLSYDIDRSDSEPSVTDMMLKAIQVLSKGDNGFLLIVEPGKMDNAAHSGDTVALVSEILAFDEAFKAAVEFAESDGQTLVIAASDHGIGGMSVGRFPTSTQTTEEMYSYLSKAVYSASKAVKLYNNKTLTAKESLSAYGISPDETKLSSDVKSFLSSPTSSKLISMMNRLTNIDYSTYGHTAENVALYLYAPEWANTSALSGVIDNTDVADYIASVLNFDLDALSKELFVDVTDNATLSGSRISYEKNGITVSMSVNGTTVKTVDGSFSLEGKIALSINGRLYLPAEAIAFTE